MDNYLLMSIKEYLSVCNKKWKGLQYLVYGESDEERKLMGRSVVQFCCNRYELINAIRGLGFQVSSLKDIDKSILKYDNPCAHQLK